MNEILQKLKTISESIENNLGTIILFALIKRTNLENKWDIIISSDWILNDKQKNLSIIIDYLNQNFSVNSDLDFLANIVPVDPKEEIITKILSSLTPGVELPKEFNSFNINKNFTIEKFHVISYKKSESV